MGIDSPSNEMSFMPDEIISGNLFLISESLELIYKRFASISKPDDFGLDDSGVTILDSIAMRLQVVGELLKKIEKENSSFLKGHDEIN
jgi:hypothetical protein